MGQAGSSLLWWPCIARLGHLFPFIPHPNAWLRWFGQRPGCSGAALWEWRQSSVTPLWGGHWQGCSACCETVPSQTGHRKDPQAPTPCCCPFGELHHSELPPWAPGKCITAACSCTSQAACLHAAQLYCSSEIWKQGGLEMRRSGYWETPATEHRCCRCYLPCPELSRGSALSCACMPVLNTNTFGGSDGSKK